MATATFGASAAAALPLNSPSQCIDLAEIDSWLNFNAIPSPTPQASSLQLATSSQVPSAMTSPASTVVPLDLIDDHQTPVAPSHEYQRFKQQTGLPTGSMPNLRAPGESSPAGSSSMFAGYNTGLDDFAMSMYDGMGSSSPFGSMTGDLAFPDTEMTSSGLPSFFFSPGDMSQTTDNFVDPAAVVKQEESQANIRFYPGMHQLQADLAKAQAQAQKQAAEERARQQQQQQQQQQQPRSSAGHRPLDPRTEETIARVVNQIRKNSSMSAASDASLHDDLGGTSHGGRSRKDDEDMDDDERLLNSEEGKKLTSKERRQLRNKVSARAFRSRRKEYISQLEGELATKVAEANELKAQNSALMQENASFRALAEKLLGHQAFRPVLEELSRDPELGQSLSKMVDSTPMQTNASQPRQFMPQPQAQNPHIGMVLVPEPQLNMASLSLGSNDGWGVPSMGMPNFQQPRVFAVLELPQPAEPLELESLSGKGEDSLLDRLYAEEEKTDMHEVEAPVKAEEPSVAAPAPAFEFDEDDDSVTLYATSRPTAAPAPLEPATTDSLSEKPSFELVITTEAEQQRLSDQLRKLTLKMDVAYNRISAMTSRLQL